MSVFNGDKHIENQDVALAFNNYWWKQLEQWLLLLETLCNYIADLLLFWYTSKYLY